MGKCQWKPEDERLRRIYGECPHAAEAGHEYCIFHISLEEKRKKPELKDRFKTEFRKLYERGDWDFTGFVFPDKMEPSKMAGYDFRRPHEKEGREAWAGEKTGPVIFREAKFGEGVDFDGAQFGRADFHYTEFSGHADFTNVEFGGEADFISAKFRGKANFINVQFKGFAGFDSVKFGEHAFFWDSEFWDHAAFRRAEFSAKGGFEETIFHKFLDFSPVKGRASAYAGRGGRIGKEPAWELELFQPGPPVLVFEKVQFKGPAKFHSVDLSRTRFQQVDLRNLSFLHSQISKTKFISCLWGDGPEKSNRWHRADKRWYRFRRPRLLFDELLWRKITQLRHHKKQAQEGEATKEQSDRGEPIDQVDAMGGGSPYKDLQASDIEVLALQLKQSLEATKDPIPAGDFHFAAMEMKREQDLEMWRESKKAVKEGKQKGKAWACRLRAGGFWWYKMLSGYGECYGRTLLWLSCLVLAAALAFAFWGGKTFAGYPGFWARLEPALFFAVQHILPFKFGAPVWEICPGDAVMRWLTLAETITGTTLFTFFALALRRRFKR